MKNRVCHLTSAHSRNDVRIFKKECVSLVKNGYEVSLVVADGLADEVIDGVKIYGVKKGESRFKRFIFSSRNVYQKAIDVDADIYHFHDPELLPYGNRLKARGKKVIFDSHEDLPRQILSKYYLPKFSRYIVSRLMEYYENYSCKKYDAVISATEYINSRFIKIVDNTELVNNYPFLDEFKNSNTNPAFSKNKICYVGGISKIRGLTQVIEALNYTNSTLILAGNVTPSYQKELELTKGWNKVEYLGQISRKKVKEVLNTSMAGIVTFLPVPNHINSQPNKLFEYMSSGIPVIASNYQLWKNIIEKYDCGICVDPESPKQISEAINYFSENLNEVRRRGENGRKAIEEVFNWEQEEKKLINLYRKIL